MTTEILDFYFVKLPEGWQGLRLACATPITEVQDRSVAFYVKANFDSLDVLQWQVSYKYNEQWIIYDMATMPNKTGIVEFAAGIGEIYEVGEYTQLKAVSNNRTYTSAGCQTLSITPAPVDSMSSSLLPVGIVGLVALGYIATRKRKRVR